MLAIVEDLVYVEGSLATSGDDVNAFLVDQVAMRLLARTFGVE